MMNVGYVTKEQRTVRIVLKDMPTHDETNVIEYTPDDGWFVDEVLPAFASNGAGVVFVLRPIP